MPIANRLLAPLRGLWARPTILDAYVTAPPSAQNAVDVFGGEWASSFPDWVGVEAGPIPLFTENESLSWALERLSGVADKRVLDLGPLEGGNAYQLANAGAEVVAVEANTRAFLKCLIAKELLNMPRSKFLLGDFVAYLATAPERFELCVASGVLYHQRSPVQTLELIASTADRLYLWTHYYDEPTISANPTLSPRFTAHEPTSHAGFAHTLHRYEYGATLRSNFFCGGSAPFGNWLSRTDLLGALDYLGWRVEGIGYEDPAHGNGPALALLATNLRSTRVQASDTPNPSRSPA